MNVNSEEYAIRFGGIWLEFHERIVAAEGNFARLESERDAARAERDAVIAEKEKLEVKYRENVASLTVAETGHLEARQIFEQVRDEHRDMSRRCLAAEAHTEWLDDQLRQQKAIRAMKEEEIETLNYRIECLKTEVAAGQQALVRNQSTITSKDEEIAALVATTKAKNEELLVLTRSLHSKDKQIALLVKEKNGLKEDLTKAQHCLASARRKESSLKQRSVAQDIAERTTVVSLAPPHSAAAPSLRASKSVEVTAELRALTPAVHTGGPPSPSLANGEHPASGGDNNNVDGAREVSVVGATLRKYKAMRARDSHSGVRVAKPARVGNHDLSRSVLLEDILNSVLSDSAKNASGSSGCEDHSAPVTIEGQPEAEEPRRQLFETPKRAWQDCAGPLPSEGGVEPLTASAAAVLLNDSDLHFIDSVLDTSLSLVEADGGTVALAREGTPVRGKGGDNRVAAALRTPETARELYRSVGGSASSISSASTVAAVRVDAAHQPPAGPVSYLAGELAAHQQRERDYKAALYLLQEEVRHLRAQVAEHDAMKRNIRLATPKGAGLRKKASAQGQLSMQVSGAVPAVSAVGAKLVKNRGCVRKLEFSSLA